jgi:hypothetical protein
MLLRVRAATARLDRRELRDCRGHFRDIAHDVPRNTLLNHFSERTAAHGDDRSTAGGGFHRNETRGLFRRAGDKQGAGVLNELDLVRETRALDVFDLVPHAVHARADLAVEVALVVREGIDLTDHHNGHAGAFSDVEGSMRALLFADASHPEQVILLT